MRGAPDSKLPERVGNITPVHVDHHFRAEVLGAGPIVLVTRMRKWFVSQADVANAFRPLLARLDPVGRHGRALVLDSRQALPNNDPEYETWMAPFRRQLIQGYAWATFVVKTPAGALH